MKIVSFGDSWAAGAELNKNEKPFVHWLSEYYSCEYCNYGIEGSSLGHITKVVLDRSVDIYKGDIVTVVVPPDVRWYSEKDGKFFSLYKNDPEWKSLMINGKTIEWFKYHHNLFMFSIISALKSTGCRFVLMHNYGLLEIQYKDLIDLNYFLTSEDNSLTEILNGDNRFDWNYDERILDDGPHTKFRGKYFEGKIGHPNELGHKRITELVINYFKEKKL